MFRYVRAHVRGEPLEELTIFSGGVESGKRHARHRPPLRVINGGFSPMSSLPADFSRGQLIESLILRLLPDDSLRS